ncbi:MAG: molecular chaperone HtpG [Candidatus Dasytiphilus stammeri]
MKEQEKKVFQSEVKQLLHLMIHSLYSNKEIFLRELISNASDAADKLRFSALTTPEIYEEDKEELHVRISINKEKRILIIDDNGIGMRRDEVINNLGTIAKSGTKSFIQSLDINNPQNQQMIGQFGVGFYSAFIVAKKVTVYTRAAGTPIEKGVFWESTGEGDYTIAYFKKVNRGTEIHLHLREEENEFLEESHISNIVSKYSDYITLPIEIQFLDKEKNKKTWKKINKAQALWTRNKSEISNKEYEEFYKNITHDISPPLFWSHNKVEGNLEYTSILYIPAKVPWNIWHKDNKNGLKLYVQRVFIMDDVEQFLPNYLRFVRGIIDSNNLPLNISREILQNSKIRKNLQHAITKRVFQMIETLAKKDEKKYQQFWDNFGLILKEGPAEDPSNLEIILQLLRFTTTFSKDSKQTISLKEYVNRMIKGQDKIYYLTSDSYAAAKSSPHLEFLQEKNIEVILLYDRIDEWMMNYLKEFEGKSFQLVSKSHDFFEDSKKDESKKSQNDKNLSSFITKVKEILKNRVKDVRITYRLTETPAILTLDANDMSTQMVKLFTAAGQKVPDIKYLFELNPEHQLIKYAIKNMDEKKIFIELIEFLLEGALLTERGSIEEPKKFLQRINNLLLLDTNKS